MYGYIYMTTNTVNGVKYIGKHKSESFDSKYLGSGILLKRAIDKYGSNNFVVEILESANSLQELNSLEIEYIKKFDCVNSDDFYNLAIGGSGGDTLIHLSPSEKEDFYRNRPNGMTGKSHSAETRKLISEALKGKTKGVPKSEHHKLKISESNKGKNLGKTSGFKGKTHSEEAKQLMRMQRIGKTSPRKGVKLSEDTKTKISNSRKGQHSRANHPLAKKCVLIKPNGEKLIFDCVNDLKDYLKEDMSGTLVKQLIKTGEPYSTNRSNKKHLNGIIVKYINN